MVCLCLEAISALRVVEIEDGAVVRVLAERRIDGRSGEDPAVPVETNQALVGVVGDGRAGLSALSIPTPNMGANAAMNEMTMVARGIQASRLPDRWEGLSSFETIIWTHAPVQNLGVEQGRALLDWVRRGGNLVIVLPESGDPWGLSAGRGRTPLADALPQRATRHDGVPVAEIQEGIRNGVREPARGPSRPTRATASRRSFSCRRRSMRVPATWSPRRVRSRGRPWRCVARWASGS